MRYLLDTDTCINIIRKRTEVLLRRLFEQTPGEVGVSSITVAELAYGVQRSEHVQQNRDALEKFLLPLAVLSFDEPAAAAYGVLRAELEAVGLPIGGMDTLIGAHALALGATLVTSNVREFSRIRSLRVEDWLVAPDQA